MLQLNFMETMLQYTIHGTNEIYYIMKGTKENERNSIR